ncbi:hypothetical protein HAX54_000736, partial [Datura stramonium]|nr:hypothetical protein [Datura stramonium]
MLLLSRCEILLFYCRIRNGIAFSQDLEPAVAETTTTENNVLTWQVAKVKHVAQPSNHGEINQTLPIKNGFEGLHGDNAEL